MRRGIRGKSKNSYFSSASGGRPPGLKGKDIGLYFRDLGRKQNLITLRVPETVVAALHDNIKSIEEVASKEGIYLEPVKELRFVKPNTDGADFIPLQVNEYEKESHHVTNIIRKDNDIIFVSKTKVDVGYEDDVIYVRTGRAEPVFISDDEATASSYDSKISMEIDMKPTAHKKARADVAFIHNIDTAGESDMKPYYNLDEENVSSTDIDLDSITYNKNKAKIEPVAGSSSTNDVILLDNSNKDIKTSKSDIKPIWILDNGTEADSDLMPDKKFEDVGSSTKLNDAMLLDDSNENIKCDIKPISKQERDNISSECSNAKSMADQKIDSQTEPKILFKPVAGSSTKLNDVVLLDDYDEDVILVASTYRDNETHSSRKDYKYGYEDIITGKFEDTLDKSLAKGIEINIKSETTSKLNEALLEEFNIMQQKPKYKEMREFRKTLPTYKMAEELLDVVNNNQVVVISGETGCGKSTQVPQIILDDAIRNKRSANTKILVTEPRRIAASSLAMRVAEERAESLGKSVGYGVRLERVECRQRGSIMFCTTGVLLVELEVNQSLSNYTHIIVDEVHERDCLIDISMCMLRQVLKKRKDLKLILMSATIDSESLSAYYDNCPMLHIKGLAFPVRDVYLEEILHMTRYRPPPPNTNNAPRKPEKPWMKHLKSRYHSASNEMAKEIQYRAQIGPWLESIKKSIDRDVYQTLQDPRIEDLDMNLIFQLLLCISRSDPGAILVFLPGIGDITKLIRLMQKSNQFPETLFDIHPLHSKLPTLTQRKIFMRPPGNIRKIIIATNIAETSITIDDIVYVVDCAKVKYKGLSVMEHVSTLNTEWASQSNLRQRRGRAGRCQPGICYHLVTSFRASQLEERLLPELLRDDLLEPVLQIKRLRLGMAEQALSMMPAVPHSKTICNAIRHLQQCGALDECETLTPLGWHLARLPVHPAAGKLLLLGALFGCLDRAASVAAVWGFKDPFNLVIGKERQVNEAKKYLALGEPSDHIAISEAIIQWENQQSYTDRNEFAREYFLSMSTLKLLSEMKNQFGNNLKQMGFLKSGNVKSIWENRNADNLALFKAIVAAALYPNIGSVRWQNLHVRRPNKQPYILVRTCDRFKVQVHPSSVMATRHDHGQKALPLCTNPGANWLVYWLKQRSTQLYLIEVTLVYTLPLLFFGELKVTQGNNSDECFIDINSIKVCCDKETTLLLFRLRSLLDQVLASKIMASGEGKRSSIFEEQVLNAVIRLITAEDARTEYLDDDDRRGSEDYNDGRAWN